MSWIAELKEKVDIVDFIIQDGVQLKSEGIDKYTALCPFHAEKTPSFKVSGTFQNYKCFGCGEYGDVIQYYAKRNALDYYTAALLLAEKYGVRVDRNSKDFEKINTNKKLYKLNEDLESFYKYNFEKLPNNHPAKMQITNRDLSVDKGEFGYAPNNDSMIEYLTNCGYTIEEIKELGHINEKGNVQQKNRLMFFIRNYMGKTVGFTGRTLDPNETNFKYVNSKASPVFNKKIALYNIDKAKISARDKEEIYIVEGQFDVEAMKQHSYENVICISGTAFTKEMIREIRRCIGPEGRIIFMLDGDKAGQKALVKVFKENPEIHSQLYSIFLPDNLDPCDYLRLGREIPEPESTVAYLYDVIKNRYNLNKPEDKSLFIKSVENNILEYIEDPQIKNIYYNNACFLVGISIDQNKISQKTKTENKIIEEDLMKDFALEDKYFIASLSFYISNHNNIEDKLDYIRYPDRYKKMIDDISDMINNDKKFIIENFSQKKLADIISKVDTVIIEDRRQATAHYNTLLGFANNIVEQKKKDGIAVEEMKKLTK